VRIFGAPDESIWVGVLRLQFRVPGARSLKDKRRVLAQLKDRIAARHKASVAEVGWLEEHVRGVVAVSVIGNDARVLRSALDTIVHGVGSWSEALIEDATIEVMRPWNDDAAGRYNAPHEE
jgi:uncharacterized protein YlxP (DUF503 family)